MAFPVGYNVARLHLNMRRPPASVVSYGLRSERRICGILVAASPPPPHRPLAAGAGCGNPTPRFSVVGRSVRCHPLKLSGIRLYLNTAHFARFRNSRITV
ncbi:hypothetical protein B0H14DRAFT_3534799 [Mycena olivaceomarginata]|nr:hypothetical protein B0H14DRAFT_3534799 [Mycena olivaceomarginata]